MNINDRVNWRAIIERHEQLDKQIRRGYMLAIISGLTCVFIGAQVWRGRWNDSLLIEIVFLAALAGLFIGAMLIIFGGYQVENLPYPPDDDDNGNDMLLYERDGPAPPVLSSTSPTQKKRPNHQLSAREWRILCAAVEKNSWRFNRAILEQAGITDLTSYTSDGRTKYGVVRDELVRAGMVIDNHIPIDKRHLFSALPPSGPQVYTSGFGLTTTGGGEVNA